MPKTSMKENDIWFSAMKYGVGWGLPRTWQGWVVYLSYFVLVFAGVYFIKGSPVRPFLFIFYVMALSGILLFICWKKGERLDFRWGDKNRD